jgi:hypothetical protein
MASNALLVTIALLLALGFWLLGQLKFLIPYRQVLFHDYATILLLWLAILFVNIFAAVYALERKFLLKDTGRKLSHLDRQVLQGQFPLPSPSETEELE